jgi:hypothetical protein
VRGSVCGHLPRRRVFGRGVGGRVEVRAGAQRQRPTDPRRRSYDPTVPGRTGMWPARVVSCG